jgi:hypothetical protein
MFCRVAFVVGIAATLAGCVTAGHNVSIDDIHTLRLERVDLVIDPAAKIDWPYLQAEYAESRKRQGDSQATEQSVLETPAFRAYVAARLQEKARSLVDPPLRSVLGGSTPVIARINLHHIKIISLAENMITSAFLGSGAAQSGMNVSIDFVDVRTNRLVVTYPRSGFLTQGGHRPNLGTTGLFAPDPSERLFYDLAGRLPSWLLKS